MESEKYFEKIETYLDGKMTSAEADAFQAELKEKPELQAMLLRRRLANQAIEIAQDNFLKDKMQAVRKQYGPLVKPQTRIISLRKWMARAAAILLLAVGGLGAYASLSHSNNALVRVYYEQAASPTIAGDEAEAEAFFSQGLYWYYQDKDYAAALQSFLSIEPNSKKYEAAQYFIAHCQLQTKQPIEALARFDQLLQNNNIPVFVEREEVEWNRLLCYLDLKEEEKTRNALQNILNQENYSADVKARAQRLNKQLNSFWRRLAVF